MRIACLPVALVLLAGCGSVTSSFRVRSRPEGLEVALQGYRLLLRGVYELEVQVANAGVGTLYRLNDREVLIQPGRGILLDGEPLDLEPGEVQQVLPREVETKPAPARRRQAPEPQGP